MTSKKFIVAVVGVIIAIAGKHGLSLDPQTVEHVVYLFVAYLLGQGIADHGKEAAKVNGTVTIATAPIDQRHVDPPQPVKDKLI